MADLTALVFDDFLARLDALDGVLLGVARFDGSFVPAAPGGLVDSFTGEGTGTRQTFTGAWVDNVLNIDEGDQWPVFPDGGGDTVVWAVNYVAQVGHADEGKAVSAIRYTPHVAANGWTYRPLNGIGAVSSGDTFEARLEDLEARALLPAISAGAANRVVSVRTDETGYQLVDPSSLNGAATSFVYVQGGPSDPSLGLYGDFDELEAALQALPAQSLKIVHVSSSFTMPARAIDLNGASFHGVSPSTNDWVFITFPTGCTVTGLNGAERGVVLYSDSDDPIVTVTDDALFEFNTECAIASRAAAFFHCTNGTGTFVTFRFMGGSGMYEPSAMGIMDGDYEVIQADGDGYVGLAEGGAGAAVTADNMIRGDGVVLRVFFASNSRPGFPSTNRGNSHVNASNFSVIRSANTFNASHWQADHADWGTLPDGSTLAETLDYLAANGGGGSGDVVGPASSTASYVALFDGTTGKLLKQGSGALGDAAYKSTGTSAGTVAAGDHTHSGTYQPLDSDLTSIAALATTSFGRSLLEAANAAALRTLAGTVIGTDVQAYRAFLANFDFGTISVPVRGAATTNGTWTLSTSGGFMPHMTNSSVASGDYIEWQKIASGTGTYTLAIMYQRSSSGGQVQFAIDGTNVGSGTIETYNASADVQRDVTTVTGVSLTAGLHTIRATSSAKNASSSGYGIRILELSLYRTA